LCARYSSLCRASYAWLIRRFYSHGRLKSTTDRRSALPSSSSRCETITLPATLATVTSIVRGSIYPLRGVAFLWRQRQLWKYAALPLVINFVFVAIAATVLVVYFDDLFAWITAFTELRRPEVWHQWIGFVLFGALKYAIGAALLVASVVAVYLVFLVLGGILAAPFNDALSQRTELIQRGQTPPEEDFSVGRLFKEGTVAIVEEVRKAGFFLGCFALIITVNLVPVVGTAIYPILSGAFAMLFASLEFVDFTMSRRKLRFAAKRAFVVRHKRPMFGFGAVMFGGLAVPVLNLFFLPIGAIAGTLLYLDLEEPEGLGSTAASSALTKEDD